MTDSEKADLLRQLTEAQGEISKRNQRIIELDQRIKDLEHQLLQVKQTKPEDCDCEPGDSVEGASDAKGKVISYSKFAKLRQSFSELTEKLTKMQEKHDRVKRELMEKLEERQKQLEGERQFPQTHHLLSSDDLEPVDGMDRDTAVEEVCRLRRIVDEKEKQVLSLKTQLESFDKTAAERQELEKHTKVQSRTVMDWRNKYDAVKVNIRSCN